MHILLYVLCSAKETPINRRAESVHIYMCIVSAPVCLCIICPMNRRWLRLQERKYIYMCIVWVITKIINSQRLFFAPLKSERPWRYIFVKSVFDSCGDDDPAVDAMIDSWRISHMALTRLRPKRGAIICGGGSDARPHSLVAPSAVERIIERNANLLGIGFQDGELSCTPERALAKGMPRSRI
jgi:hypothetical protein